MARENDNGGLNVWWFAAGGFLLVVVIATVLAVLWPADDGPSASKTQSSEESATAGEESPGAGGAASGGNESPSDDAASTDSSSGDSCEVPDGSSDFPATAPDFEWQDHPIGLSLPVSDEHGPASMEEGYWHCTSHTSAGAVFAGPALLASFSNGTYEAAVDTPSAREVFDTEQSLSSSADAVFRGYQVVQSSDQSATVDYWVQPESMQADMSFRLHLIWDEGTRDWKLDLKNGQPEYAEVTDTSDYTAFE